MTSLTLSLRALQLAERSRPSATPWMSRSVEIAVRQGVRLNRLIGDLLDVSRIESGRFPIDRSDVDLGALVRDVFVPPTDGCRHGRQPARSGSPCAPWRL